jgi:hypothetical protein
LFPQTLFKQIEIEVGSTQVNDLSTPTYAFKAYIETLFSYGLHADRTFLDANAFEVDAPGMESILTEENPGFIKRKEMISGSQNFAFSTIIHADFNHMERYMLPGVQIKYLFIRNIDTFSLLAAANNYQIQIKDLYMSIYKVRARAEIHNSIMTRLKKEVALYPITQSKIRTFLINSGISSINIQNLSSGNLPKFVLIGFLDDRNFSGRIGYNPWIFKHFNLNFLNLYINGEPVLKTPLQPDYDTGKWKREYQMLLDNIGVQHSNAPTLITPQAFKHNTNFYAFDLNPDLCNGYHTHHTKQGQIDIILGWKQELLDNLRMLVYTSYKQVLTIDSDFKGVLLD